MVLNERNGEAELSTQDIFQKISDIDKANGGQPSPIEESKAAAKKSEVELKKKSSLDADVVKQIEESILDHSPNVAWDDI